MKMKLNDVKMTCRWGAPYHDDWRKDADGWTCTLTYQGRRMTTGFWMGMAHNGAEPDLRGVLDCLCSDAEAGEMSFEEFCGEFGYDEDSRTAERTWKECQKSGAKVLRLFDLDELREMLNDLDEADNRRRAA